MCAPSLTRNVPLQIQRGAAASRADDVKGIKTSVVEWIADPKEGLKPPIGRNNMFVRGWNHEVTGRLLIPAGMDWERYVVLIVRVHDPHFHVCMRFLYSEKGKLRDSTLIITGDQWPIFIYENETFNPEDP